MIIFVDLDMRFVFIGHELIETQFIVYTHLCHLTSPPKLSYLNRRD